MARVPKVARETISRGTPSLGNLPKKMADSNIYKRLQYNLDSEVVQNFKFPHCENNIAKLIQNIPRATYWKTAKIPLESHEIPEGGRLF